MSDDKKQARGLGRGLSALLGDDAEPATAPGSSAAGSRPVPIEHLHRGRFQPRRNFDPEQIQALADSMRAQGVLQPLLVRPHPELPGEYEILAGERRWRAAQVARLTELPVLVRDLGNREALEIALVENVQRQDLNAIEEARGYQRLVEEFGHTQEEIARVTGKSRPHIANTLRLLNLPEEVIVMVEEGKLSAGHVRPLVGHARALEIALDAARYGATVRQIENMARSWKERPAEETRYTLPKPDVNIRALERELETLTGMGNKIMAKNADGVGTIAFYYSNLDQIDELLEKLRAR
jgi:ParB family chromosome partitioning protein